MIVNESSGLLRVGSATNPLIRRLPRYEGFFPSTMARKFSTHSSTADFDVPSIYLPSILTSVVTEDRCTSTSTTFSTYIPSDCHLFRFHHLIATPSQELGPLFSYYKAWTLSTNRLPCIPESLTCMSQLCARRIWMKARCLLCPSQSLGYSHMSTIAC